MTQRASETRLPKSLSKAKAQYTTVTLPDAQWRLIIAVVGSATTMMDSAVHVAATRKVLDALVDKTGIEVNYIGSGE